MTIYNKEWPDLPCYLLLDVGKNPVINSWIDDTYNSYAIYLNTPYAELAPQSPKLVELSFESKLWSVFQRQGIYSQWGIVLFSLASFDELVAQCQWWIQVKTQTKMTGIFRLYDTNFCYQLLHHSNDDQRARLLGIVNMLCCFKDGWHKFINPNPQRVNYKTVLSLDDDQWQAVTGDKSAAFKKRLHQHVLQLFPHLLKKKDLAQQQQWISMLLDEAKAMHFTAAQDIFMFVNIVGILGMDALNPKVHPEIYQLLTNQGEGAPSKRVQKAASLAQHAIRKVFID